MDYTNSDLKDCFQSPLSDLCGVFIQQVTPGWPHIKDITPSPYMAFIYTQYSHYLPENIAVTFNSLVSGRDIWDTESIIFKLILNRVSCAFPLKLLDPRRPPWGLVNTGSGNGLVPSGNKPLPEAMLAHINVTIWQYIYPDILVCR